VAASTVSKAIACQGSSVSIKELAAKAAKKKIL
jgi:hypothetical protein